MPLLQLFCAAVLLLMASLQQYGLLAHRQMVIHSHPSWRPYTDVSVHTTLFPTYRLVALYGEPGTPFLGALGDQSFADSISRVQQLAEQYRPLTSQHILPTLEIIASVASAAPEPDGSYSYQASQQHLMDWVVTAKKHGVYVVLDVQPGREDFVTQAKRLEPELVQPNVGLALDPEWRLGPTQLPLEQVGSVGIGEVNRTAGWLADLTKQHALPQKLLLLHEFRLSMLPDRDKFDTSRPELAYAIQMDGQGTQPQKLDTWQSVTASPPRDVHFGWKNFYAKDMPMRSPQETMALSPQPWYVSYQ